MSTVSKLSTNESLIGAELKQSQDNRRSKSASDSEFASAMTQMAGLITANSTQSVQPSQGFGLNARPNEEALPGAHQVSAQTQVNPQELLSGATFKTPLIQKGNLVSEELNQSQVDGITEHQKEANELAGLQSLMGLSELQEQPGSLHSRVALAPEMAKALQGRGHTHAEMNRMNAGHLLSMDANLAQPSENLESLYQLGGEGVQEVRLQRHQKKKPLESGLSGGEFLGTLQSVQGKGSEKQSPLTQLDAIQGKSQRIQKEPLSEAELKKKENPSEKLLSEDFSTQLSRVDLGKGQSSNSTQPVAVQTAQVTFGSGAENRLSTESVMGMSSQVRVLSKNGGGEMWVKLNPEHLGQLRVRVMANGNQVGLQIHATDDKAKRVIEESLNALRESMSAQQLVLGQVDVSVVPQAPQMSQDLAQDSQSSQGHHQFQDNLGQSQNQNFQDQRENFFDRREMDSDFTRVGLRPSLRGNAQQAFARASEGRGRIDLQA